MAGDAFLKLDDVEGESLDSKHEKEIDVISWSWSVHNATTAHRGPGAGKEKASFGELAIMKHLDHASPTLFQKCTLGTHIDNGKLTVRKAGGDDPLEYFTLDMKHIFVTNVSPGGSQGSDAVESVSLSFEEFKIEYKTQEEEGAAGAGSEFGFNIAKHAKA